MHLLRYRMPLTRPFLGDTIWVAKGVYYPTSTYNITGGSAARLYTFVDNNTNIYGGFNGTETKLNSATAR